MSSQSSPVLKPVPVDDKILASEKAPYRTSIFTESDELPRLWGRDSQSGYTGEGTLTPHSYGEKDSSSDLAATNEGKTGDVGRRSMPADYGYELPERYGGNQVAYGDNAFKLLSENNNTWIPPYKQRHKICGLGPRMFWTIFGIISLLILSGAVAAGLVSAAISKSLPSHKSSSSTNSVASSAALETSTETSLTLRTSTMSMPDESLVFTTVVIALVQTITPQTASATPTPLPLSTTNSTPNPIAVTILSLSPASPTRPAAASSNSLEPISPSPVPATSATTESTLTLLEAPQSSSPP